MRAIDETGNKYHRLQVLGRSDDIGGKKVGWVCQCDCGNVHIVRGENLRNGRTKSCGCLQKELMSQRNKKHGFKYGSPEYKEHARNLRLIRKYGITLDDQAEMMSNQDNKCLICDSAFDELEHAPHVDHCHNTGAVRGVLCMACNTGLGHFLDDIGRLESAIKYLKRNN